MKIKIVWLTVMLSLLNIMYSEAQSSDRDKNRPRPITPTNFGLTAPQDPATLPASRVAIVMPERKAKKPAQTILRPAGYGCWIIENGWELTEGRNVTASRAFLFDRGYDTFSWYNATVPGTVLTTLVDQGVYPDPYFGINNLAIPDSLCRTDWWYRTTFTAPANKDEQRAWLVFKGINYRADVWLNGKFVGDINSAFVRGRFDVTEYLQVENVLAVHIRPPHNPGIPHEQSSTALRGPNGGQLCLDGPTFISSEGWDWIPGMRDRNMGIWQDVAIAYTGAVTLGDFQVITDLPLPDLTKADITVRGTLTNHSAQERKVTVSGVIEKINFSKEITIPAGTEKKVSFTVADFPQLRLQQPRLWWPNGYGAQELYDMTLVLSEGNHTAHSKEIRFGIRELSYELTADTPSKEARRIALNPIKDLASGKPVFDFRHQRKAEGAVIPALLPGVDETSLTEIANDETSPFLVIQVNGVRIFCKGGNWGMDDGMKRVSRERLEPYIRLHRDANYNMIRNWTGESTEEVFYELCDEYGMLVWNDFWISTEGYNLNPNDEDLFMANASDVVRRFVNHPSIALWCPRNEGYAPPALETRLNEMIASADGTRHYHGNSRDMNLRPSGGWYYITDQTDYFSNQAKGFNTELGTGSVPTAESMRKMMAEEDLWPVGGDVWHYHDLHFGLEGYRAAIDSLYGESAGLDEFCRKAQMVNYDSHRAMFESWNSRMWNSTSGLLLWMSHPAWPSVVWQTYSWDYETFGAYFGCRTACEPLHIQMNLHDNKVCIINTSNRSYLNVTASLHCYDMNGKLLLSRDEKISNAPANRLTECFTGEMANLHGNFIARVTLSANGKVLSLNDYLKTGIGTVDFRALNSLPQVILKAKPKGAVQDGKISVEVSNPCKTAAIRIKLNLRNVQGEAVLPVYFSEGYFNLLPGEKRIVEITCPAKGRFSVSSDGYTVAPDNLIYVNF